jgi:endonuclease G
MPYSFLFQGYRKGQAVCRIELERGRGRATISYVGYVKDTAYFLTNNHVIPDSKSIAQCQRIQFFFEEGATTVDLENFSQATLVATNAKLDYSLVSVPLTELPEGVQKKYNALPSTVTVPSKGEPVNLIHHPEGKPKRITIRGGKILNMDAHEIFHSGDTKAGSSGSPVFDDQWNWVSLHKVHSFNLLTYL